MTEKEMIDDETGTRFHPNEEELVNHYLKRRVLGLDSNVNVPIAEVKVLQHEPYELPAFSKKQSDDPFWYFFYRLDYKYLNSTRADRRTKGGYWKATGKDREVKSRDTKKPIGSKKTLVFHEGRVSKKVTGQGFNWVIHEYRLTSNIPNPDAYVIGCLKKEPKKKAKRKANTSISVEGECSHQSPSDFVNRVAENTTLEETGACPVDPPSQTDMKAAMCAQQGQYDQDRPLSNSISIDTLSQADLEVAFFELYSQLLSPQQGPSDQDLPSSNASNSDPPSEVDLAAVCQNFPLPNGFSNGIQTQFGTINECKTYPVAINGGAIGMSSAQPLESISQISDCEDGGVSNDTNKEEAITQAREDTEHVIAADLPLSPELSHNSTQNVNLSPELSHNSTQHDNTTHLSPQLSHSFNASMDEYFEDFIEFVSQDLTWL